MGRPLIYSEDEVLQKVYNAKPNLIFNDNYMKYSIKHHWKCKNHPDIDIFRSPKHLVERHSVGCPICNHRITKKSEEEALDVCYLELMEYWDYDKNIGVSPNNFTKCSEFIAFWKCKKNHSFQSKIKDVVMSYENTGRFYCPYCENNKILVGFNDLWTTHPDIAKLLVDPNDGHKYTYGSGVKVNWKCSSCNSVNIDYINHLTSGRSKCKFCSDNFSMCEKIMLNVLKQLNIKFKYQLTKAIFNWCDNYKYDFYLYDTNTIIETHGGQHYKENGFGKGRNDKEIDKIKRKLAMSNKITNYIEIDCRYSDFDFIKNNILKSHLATLYNLNDINWAECFKNACNSMLLNICDDYKNKKPISYLLKKYKISNTTICRYLHIGDELGLCNYDRKTSHLRAVQSKRVYCKTTNKVFNSIRNAAQFYDICESGISACANGHSSFSGKYNDLKLVWSFNIPSDFKEEDILYN